MAVTVRRWTELLLCRFAVVVPEKAAEALAAADVADRN